MTARLVAMLFAVGVVVAMPVRMAAADAGEEQTKQAARHLLIAMRVLSYDKQLTDRATGSAVTIVLLSSATSEGRALRDRFESGFGLMPKVKVAGRSVRLLSFDVTSEKQVTAVLANSHANAVLVLDDLGGRMGDVLAATRARGVLSISMREVDAERGLAVAIVEARERDQIVINVDAARAERVRFGAGLLQLARLVP